jgi:hypothetical protein
MHDNKDTNTTTRSSGRKNSLLLDINDLLQSADLALHAVNAFHQNENLLPGAVSA